MVSTLISNPITNSNRATRKKNKALQATSKDPSQNPNGVTTQWKSKSKKYTLPNSSMLSEAESGNAGRRSRGVSILWLRCKNLPAVERKARVLGRLVPGCMKEP
ncbi:hypothetical protein RHGRI_003218 [Rhododendron griersonianum]|uniref:Uncharacterized protein n=1 Tax=Rhododendron griersonianum TaxID=479676 RepID=A0AAV6L479_9ERIC|nr:hypothetical protein RHGRI_003218 [Rhododendron griersonianum]